jgi:hypothetical protein
VPITASVIIDGTDVYLTVAIKISKASLCRHARFIEQLAAMARRD